jgi:vanillate monooxygenase ferredoxin subunit
MTEETDTLRPLKVGRKTSEAHQMVTFELVDPDGAELPPFFRRLPYFVTIPSNELVRQYSLIKSEKERHRYVISCGRDGIWQHRWI